jgi:hypothetical protein
MHRVQKVPVSRIFALLAYASADGCNPNVNASAVGANSVPVLNLRAMMVSPVRRYKPARCSECKSHTKVD